MAIRKILLPLQLTAAAATFSMAVMVARLWRAHLGRIACCCKPRSGKRRARLVREADSRARSGCGRPETRRRRTTASFATVIGREPDAIVAHQARLVDLIVVPHPAGDKDVLSSDALHAVLFDWRSRC